MSRTYHFHFSFDENNQTKLIDSLLNISVTIKKKYFDIPIYDHNSFYYKEKLLGIDKINWYDASVTSDNMELLAFIYQKFLLLPPPIIFGIPYDTIRNFYFKDFSNPELLAMSDNLSHIIRQENVKDYVYKNIIRQLESDKSKVESALITNGFYSNSKIINLPTDYFLLTQEIENLIAKKDYLKIGVIFSKIIANTISNENFKENLYIKRINFTRFIAKDFLPLQPQLKKSELIQNNLEEFQNCVDQLLSVNEWKLEEEFRNIINDYVPTIESLSAPIEQKSYSYNNGKFEEYKGIKQKTLGSFYINPKNQLTCYCLKGIIFDYFPDPIHASRTVEDRKIEKKYLKIWTTLSPSLYQNQLEKGLTLSNIDTYWHNKWRMSKRIPEFEQLTSTSDLSIKSIACEGITFTGRTHTINDVIYYEIDLIRYCEPKVIGNEIRNFVAKLFWDAENLLRANHNLPKIGEGWLSEMRMFELISSSYPDALLHHSPNWLKPQHFDVYIPCLKIAFEYQGKQHFEPIDYFGSEEGFINNQRRDFEKLQKSKKNKVEIIYWNYFESINRVTLEKKIREKKQKKVSY